ncbi:MAG: radical SAM protein [Ferruginibacter sp.]
MQSLLHTYKRYRTLKTHRISVLPIVILMPHSACNCRCVMCDIWKGNANLSQLTLEDISRLTGSLKELDTRQVVLSGGEALLNKNFFALCALLKKEKLGITLLSTGITLRQHAAGLVEAVDEIIISLDGTPGIHDAIRNIPGAFLKLAEGIDAIRQLDPGFRISGRTVIHRLNFQSWPAIIDTARDIGLQQISFLPADVSSHAFNRPDLWTSGQQAQLLLGTEELRDMRMIIEDMLNIYRQDFETGFIAESPEKIRKIYQYYAAFHGRNEFPYKRCNAPWVSVVVEPDGKVRPCFFHEPYGQIKEAPLRKLINNAAALAFRRELDIRKNPTCIKCVCSLNLPPRSAV